ncbi:MAG: sulfatase-like hydrolase/transferase [Planctomycetes bacterium]|nr:sulfatase-like hydrolase/transferase [Planctomycetota bacterium]
MPNSRVWRCLCILTALVVAGCERSAPTGPSADRPSVLLITLDTTRADHLSCYGYPQQTSANLDRLAQRGTLFTAAIAQAAVTPVSHASILTGLNPYNHGLRVMHGTTENRLRDSCTTLAETLGAAGYQTAAFVSAFPVTARFGLDQGFETFDAEFIDDAPEQIVSATGAVNTGRNQRRADETTDRALAWLAQARRPFFLWLHYFDPHDPLVLPPREYIQQHNAVPQPRDQSEALRAIYDVEIRYMDLHIGRILDRLALNGKLEEVVTVVVADHGEGLGDHDWWTHGILYQEQIRVPLLIQAPGKPGGRRVDNLVRTIDIMPTICDLVGLPATVVPRLDGQSLAPLLSGSAPDAARRAYSDSVNMLVYRTPAKTQDVKNDMLFAVVDGPWKYIHHLLRSDESELYNLQDDPAEQKNLYATHPEQVARLLADLREREFAPREQPGTGSMSPEDIARLKALGYIRQDE